MKITKHSTIDNLLKIARERKFNVYTGVSADVADEMHIPKSSLASGLNDKRDAFRHAYTAALMSFRWGENLTRIGGYANEHKNDFSFKFSSPFEEWMDFYNNEKGLIIAREAKLANKSEGDIKQLVRDALDRGELVITPYDPRRTYWQHFDWKKAVEESQKALQQDRDGALAKATADKRQYINDLYDEWDKERRGYIEKYSDQMASQKIFSKHTVYPDAGAASDINPTTVPSILD